ncbi:Quinate permease, partial [Tolypocladium capitatum]
MAAMAKMLRSIVRNDAMRTDPDEVYGWRVFALVCSACFGGMLFGWDTGAIGGVLAMTPAQKTFGTLDQPKDVKANLDQNIVSTLQAGCFAACLAISWLADKYGRRPCLVATGALTTVGVVLQAASAANGTLAAMYVGRFVAGLGVGAASTLTPFRRGDKGGRDVSALTLIDSILPAVHRLRHHGGLLVRRRPVVAGDDFVSAHAVSSCLLRVNYGCLLHVPAPAVYVVPLALQALPALYAHNSRLTSRLARVGVPERMTGSEPPAFSSDCEGNLMIQTWECKHEPRANSHRLPADSEYVSSEIQEMADQLEIERRLTGDATAKALLKEMFMVPGNRNRAIISIVLMICQQMTGVNAI